MQIPSIFLRYWYPGSAKTPQNGTSAPCFLCPALLPRSHRCYNSLFAGVVCFCSLDCCFLGDPTFCPTGLRLSIRRALAWLLHSQQVLGLLEGR